MSPKMLKAISWIQLAIAFALLVIPYYLYVGWKYYRKEITAFLRAPSLKKLLGLKKKEKTTSIILTEAQFLEAYQEIEQITYEFRQKILPQAKGSQEKLSELLTLRLGSFQGLIVPAFRLTISEELIKIAAQRSIELQKADMEDIWQKLLAELPAK